MNARRATAADLPALTRVLAAAFRTDPVMDWFVRRNRRDAAMLLYFRTALRLIAMPHDETWTTPDAIGAALWIPPGEWRMSLPLQLRLFPHIARIVGLARLNEVRKGGDIFVDRHPAIPHWYLFALGVDPSVQGRGLGGSLMAPVLERCDREKTGAYLETATERNVVFYRRHGFEVTGEVTIERGPKVWLMWRAPRE